MTSSFLKILAFFSHPARLFSEGSAIAFTRFHLQKGNVLRTCNSIIKKSKLSVIGNGNSIEIGKADLYRSVISIVGKNNRLIIGGSSRIYNLTLIIKSDNSTITIGERTSFAGGHVVCAGESNSISFGKDCMIAEGVDIWNSDTHTITIQGEPLVNHKPITIQDHVWLGKDVTVLKGVTIGADAIIGMRSIVTRDIRPGTVNAGVPAIEIKDGANWVR